MTQKGFSSVFVIFAILILTMIAGTAYYLGLTQNSKMSQTSVQLPTPKPTSTTSEVDSDKSKVSIYKDNYLKVQFSYPGDLNLNSLEAEENDPRSLIYISKNPTKERQEAVDYVVKCNKDNRADPSGVCVEGITADLDIYIFKDTLDPATYLSEESDKQCQKTQAEGKTTYSCVTAGLGGKETYRYSVYLESPSTKMVIDARDKVNNQEIIKKIIDSFRVQ